MRPGAIVFDSNDNAGLSLFYAELLNWERSEQTFEGDKWFIVSDPEMKGLPLVFQQDDGYIPPVWPDTPGRQRQMLHVDFYIGWNEMEQAVRHAIKCGARSAKIQFSESWQVFLDPAGHPFCIIPIPPDAGFDPAGK